MINEAVSLDDVTNWAPSGSCARLRMLRLDTIHPVVSGNKWFKLIPNLKAARYASFRKILSFGGGYSNHLVALGFAAKEEGFAAVGIVRGHYSKLTPSLQSCTDFGMELRFVSGTEYASLKNGTGAGMRSLFPGHWIIPEGGANESGIQGASAIAGYVPETTTDVCLAVGTGTTLAGMDLALPQRCLLHGYSVAKDMTQAEALISASRFPARIQLHGVSDPRFGRWTADLPAFMRDFFSVTGIALDVVYTGKMMQQLRQQLQGGAFAGRDIVCVHTGGLQGNPAGLFM